MAQTIILVSTTQNNSLRDQIARDEYLENYCLRVTQMKKNTRSNGWTKIHSTDKAVHGAINIEWDSGTQILTSRIVTKGDGNPSQIAGQFVCYLLDRFDSAINIINVIKK